MLYLFRSQGEWLVTDRIIQYYYNAECFFMKKEIGNIFSKGLITNNMIAVFRWICDNMTIGIDSWNFNDNEYGPSNIGCFKGEVLSVAKHYPDTPIMISILP